MKASPSPCRVHVKAGTHVVNLQLMADGSCSAAVPIDSPRMPGRLQVLLAVGRAALSCSSLKTIALQFHDEDPDEPCLNFDDAWNSSEKLLIPDPYCLASDGFRAIWEDFERDPLPTWRERRACLFWRGATTGMKALTVPRISQLPRYGLCSLSRQLPGWVDARFTDVVQARDQKAGKEIQQLLKEQNLLRERVAPRVFGQHRWLIDIDGNVNSWGLIWKMFSGSCLLRVASSRRQWFHHRMVPYQHFVPVAANLENLEGQLEWCHENLDHCEAIAGAGRDLALEVIAEQGLDLVTALQQWRQRSPSL